MTNTNNKKRKSFGKTLRNTVIAAGVSALSILPFNANGQTNQDKDPNYIFANEPAKVTAAGDGILAKSYIQNLPLTPNSNISIDSLFWAKDGNIHFKVKDSQESLNNIKNYLGSQGKLTGKEKAFKNHLNNLEKYASENPSDSASIERLNKAVEDGTLSVKEDSLYNPKTEEWNIEDGTYMLIAKNKDNSQSIPIYTDISTHKEKSPILERKGIESTLYGHNNNNEDTTSAGGSTFVKYDIEPQQKSEEGKKDKEKQGYHPVRLDLGGGIKTDTRVGNLTNKFGILSGNASLQFDISRGEGSVWLGPYASFSPNSKKIDVNKTDLESEKELVNRSEHGDTYRTADSSYVTTTTSSQPLDLGVKTNFELGKTSELELMLGATKTNASKKLEGEKHVEYSKDGDVFNEYTLTGEDKDKFDKWTGTIGAGFKQYLTDSKTVSINADVGYNFPLESTNSTFKDNFYGEAGIGINIGGKK